VKYTRFATTRVAASSVADLLKDKRRKLTLRPWNRFEPDYTTWWIVPGTAWPAYRYGKFVFTTVGELISCGLYVEKGLGASTMGMYKPSLVMDADWQWHQFIRDIESGKVMEATNMIGMQPFLTLSSDIVRGEFDPLAPKSDELVFRIADGKLEKVQERIDVGCLTPFANLESLEKLPGKLAEMKNLNWAWIDLVLGTQLKLPIEGVELTDAIDGWDLVSDLFSYLEPWFM